MTNPQNTAPETVKALAKLLQVLYFETIKENEFAINQANEIISGYGYDYYLKRDIETYIILIKESDGE